VFVRILQKIQYVCYVSSSFEWGSERGREKYLGVFFWLAGIPYAITVKTGDVSNAGTSASVYCVMYGGRGGDRSSGKIWLTNGKFQRGRTDLFNVEVLELLSPLSRLDVGHDNKGAGAGWFLEEASTSDRQLEIYGGPTGYMYMVAQKLKPLFVEILHL